MDSLQDPIAMWRMAAYSELALSLAMLVCTLSLGIETGVFFAVGACLLLVVRQAVQASHAHDW